MRMSMIKNVKSCMPNTDNAKEFIFKIKEHYQLDIADKYIIVNLMSEITTKKFNWSQLIHDHEMDMQT